MSLRLAARRGPAAAFVQERGAPRTHATGGLRRRATLAVASLLVAGLGISIPAAAGAPAGASTDAGERRGTIRLVALDNNGGQAPHKSRTSGAIPVTSAEGRYVVFSTESALVPHDVNGTDDVYLRDMEARTTTLVSVTRRGVQGNDYSFEPSISANGRYVAFTTWSTTLFRGDDNGSALDVVVKDLRTGKLRLVSRTTGGAQVRQNSFSPVISGNGRYVLFQSFGRFNGTDDDRREDIYLHDLETRVTQQASVDSRGRDLPARYLAGGISHTGRYVTFGDDNNAYVRDVRKTRTVRFWHEPNEADYPGGTVGRPVVSGNGKFVAFSTASEFVVPRDAGHIVDIFRLNLQTGRFRLVTVVKGGVVANDDSFIPSLSYTGRYVGFSSFASNLVANDVPGSSDTFIRDMRTKRIRMTSAGPNGLANSDSGRNSVSISADGKHMVYESYASDLVLRDSNNQLDVFWWRAPSAR